MEKVTIISCFISENWRTGKHGHQQQKPLAYEGGFLLIFILDRLFLAVNWNVFIYWAVAEDMYFMVLRPFCNNILENFAVLRRRLS